jgi:hypothetical protein
MTDAPETTDELLPDFDIWQPCRGWHATPEFRWAVPPHTSTKPRELQQAWINLDAGDVDWRVVPTVVVEALDV